MNPLAKYIVNGLGILALAGCSGDFKKTEFYNDFKANIERTRGQNRITLVDRAGRTLTALDEDRNNFFDYNEIIILDEKKGDPQEGDLEKYANGDSLNAIWNYVKLK